MEHVVLPDRRRRKECWRGFTLIELVIVLAMLGTLAAIGIPAYANYLEKAKIARAIGDIVALGTDIWMYEFSTGDLPETLAAVGRGNFLDPWGNPYRYVKICSIALFHKECQEGQGQAGQGEGGADQHDDDDDTGDDDDDDTGGGTGGGGGGVRMDRFLKPLNSDYDLYSIGRDGRTAAALTAPVSWDDIIRANDGMYVGLASAY